MVAKINAAMRAVQGAVTSVVIANGINPYTIEQVSTHTELAYIEHACDLCYYFLYKAGTPVSAIRFECTPVKCFVVLVCASVRSLC
jgi:hypothetical protein